MQKNTGERPAAAVGKRVHVILRNGFDTREHANEKDGWFAGNLEGWPKGCRWSLTGHPFDIMEWELKR